MSGKNQGKSQGNLRWMISGNPGCKIIFGKKSGTFIRAAVLISINTVIAEA